MPSAAPVPEYRVIQSIRKGAMGEVLLAEQQTEEGPRKVVLKRPTAGMDTDLYEAMFLSETVVMMKLNHPNIVRMLGRPEIDGARCLALEYVEGKDIAHLLDASAKSGTTMPYGVAIYVALKLLEGLHYAHDFRLNGRPLELVHRDIAPGNVLISFEGEVKLADFGIAKSRLSALSTGAGTVKGTPGYMSPEQVRCEEVNARSDIYSAAVLILHMLSGVSVFLRENVLTTLIAAQTCQRPQVKDVLPFEAPQLAAVLERALSMDPEDRFETAAEFAQAILQTQDPAVIELGPKALRAFLAEIFPDRVRSEPASEVDPRIRSMLMRYLRDEPIELTEEVQKTIAPKGVPPPLAKINLKQRALETPNTPVEARSRGAAFKMFVGLGLATLSGLSAWLMFG